jgi:hypothetical protein
MLEGPLWWYVPDWTTLSGFGDGTAKKALDKAKAA